MSHVHSDFRGEYERLAHAGTSHPPGTSRVRIACTPKNKKVPAAIASGYATQSAGVNQNPTAPPAMVDNSTPAHHARAVPAFPINTPAIVPSAIPSGILCRIIAAATTLPACG